MHTVYDPTDPVTRNRPHDVLAYLRKHDPIHWSPQLKGWIVTRYDDVMSVANSSQLSVDKFTPFYRSLPAGERSKVEDLVRYLSLWLVFRDPPDHTRLRLLLQRAFTPKAMQAIRPNVAGVVAHLLDGLNGRDDVDLVQAFTIPLPAYVIMDMLGVPRNRFREMKAWSDDMQLFIGSAQGIADKYERARTGVLGMAELFRGLVAERRREPRADVLTTLVNARDDEAGSGKSKMLSDDELVSSCILFLFAGHETTTHLLGAGSLLLLRDPAARDRFIADDGLTATAVEEFLRFEGPINSFARAAVVEHELGGKTIRAGDRLFAMVSAANRDPTHFNRPDEVDLGRSPNRHVTFGYGTHFCLGAPLARMEAQIALPALHRRYPKMSLRAEPEWIDSMIMRGIRTLDVLLGPMA